MSTFGDFGPSYLGMAIAGSPAPSMEGVLVHLGNDLTFASGTNAITYDAETYDPAGYHSLVSNTDRLTIPLGPTRGRLVINTLQVEGIRVNTMAKNGATFAGRAIGYNVGATGDDATNIASAIVTVAEGDYLNSSIVDGVTLRDFETWASFEPIVATIKGALVKKTGTQALSANTTTEIAFEAEEYDTDAFHDNVTNNTRLTVPSGVGLVRLSASMETTAIGGSDQGVLVLNKGGASVLGRFAKDVPGTDCYVCAVSAILAVSPGDYFEATARTTDAETIQAVDNTWFQIEEIPATRKYALVYKFASQAISIDTWTAMAFAVEAADTDAFHDTVTNNTRLTVPAGVARARLSFNAEGPSGLSATATLDARVTKNGVADIPGLPSCRSQNAGTELANGFGAWVEVVAGDYFELELRCDESATIPVGDTMWFQIEAE